MKEVSISVHETDQVLKFRSGRLVLTVCDILSLYQRSCEGHVSKFPNCMDNVNQFLNKERAHFEKCGYI